MFNYNEIEKEIIRLEKENPDNKVIYYFINGKVVYEIKNLKYKND